METKYSPKKKAFVFKTSLQKTRSPSIYNIRLCPSCGSAIYGMPGGRDATCAQCGYKDPCCSD